MNGFRRTTRRGFTLVELLVVIAIIAVLVAMMIPATFGTGPGNRAAVIRLELMKIEQGLEWYKNQYRTYPPDFSDPAIVRRHFRELFPKMAADEQLVLEHILANETIDRAEALFLALHGYSPDDTHPLTGPGGPLDATDASSFASGNGVLLGSTGMPNSLITFEESKVAWTLAASGTSYESTEGDGDVFPVYMQRGTDTPFVYFDARTYVYHNGSNWIVNHYQDPNNSSAGTTQPYKSADKTPKPDPNEDNAWNQLPDGTHPKTLKFANSDTFQIVTAGQDGKFSAVGVNPSPTEARVYPTGINYKTEDLDNIVNFGEKSTLEGDLP